MKRNIVIVAIIAGAISIGSTTALITTLQDGARTLSNVTPSSNSKFSAPAEQLNPKQNTAWNEQTLGTISGRLSPFETKQVSEMLVKLGYNTNTDIKDVIRQYQKDSGLSPSGYLDVETLDRLVAATRLERVRTLEDKFHFE